MRKSRLVRLSLAVFASAIAAVIAVLFVYVSEHREFDGYAVITRATPRDAARPSRVAVLGDSWVAAAKLDLHLEAALASRGFEAVEVASFGQGGAVSRAILRNLLAPSAAHHASSAVLADPSIRYAVVVAGVNDTALHRGADFYAHHLVAISTVLLNAGITPVVVEVPEYGIEHLDPMRSTLGKARERLYRRLFDGGEVDVIAAYRGALRLALREEGLSERVVMIGGDRFIRDYDANEHLYENASHLNESGNQKLAELIATTLVDEWGTPD